MLPTELEGPVWRRAVRAAFAEELPKENSQRRDRRAYNSKTRFVAGGRNCRTSIPGHVPRCIIDHVHVVYADYGTRTSPGNGKSGDISDQGANLHNTERENAGQRGLLAKG
jgi:hypothetical protein